MKRIDKPTFRGSEYAATFQELVDTEKEFAEVLSTYWEVVASYPILKKRALKAANRIRELRVLLVSKGVLPRTIH